MILPERCGIMTLAASYAISKAAVRFTATVASHCSRPKSRTQAIGQMPALLTRMSREPSRSTQAATISAGAPGLVTSALMNS